MKVLVTGGGGMLARALHRVGTARGDEVISVGRAELDVTDAAAVLDLVRRHRPQAVVQGAAYTAVDRAESEREAALAVNVEGARNVARACQKTGCIFVYPSTDYVFGGEGVRPYLPTDPPGPINVYGESKWLGELAAAEAGRALIVRTSWLYGAGGANFVDTIARLATERKTLEIVDDQIGRPTWTVALAEVIGTLLMTGALGTFHASGGGEPVSWAGVARAVAGRLAAGVEVHPIRTAELARPAARPRYSVLDLTGTEAVIGRRLWDWRDSLASYLRERQP